jgi:hypothetical protein
VSFYVSTGTFVLLHCDEWDRVVALPRHKFVTGATLLQLVYIQRLFHGLMLSLFLYSSPINEISKSEEKKKIIVTIEEVEKAIQKLNSGKAADEYGITAEHVKFAGLIFTFFKDRSNYSRFKTLCYPPFLEYLIKYILV